MYTQQLLRRLRLELKRGRICISGLKTTSPEQQQKIPFLPRWRRNWNWNRNGQAKIFSNKWKLSQHFFLCSNISAKVSLGAILAPFQEIFLEVEVWLVTFRQGFESWTTWTDDGCRATPPPMPRSWLPVDRSISRETKKPIVVTIEVT